LFQRQAYRPHPKAYTVEFLKELSAYLEPMLNYPLVQLSNTTLTLSLIITLLLLFAAVVILQYVIRRHLLRRVLAQTRMDMALQYAISKIVGYLVAVLGFYVSLQMVGIDLSSLAIIAGAVGVGLGFGLQNIINNFVSGLIILAERPVAIGDRVEVGGVAGRVDKISLRSTTVVTNDNIAIIVPNADFISTAVTNWSYGDPKVRFRIPVGVHYKSDVHIVEKALLESASECPNVLKEPAPCVRFIAFGDSSLDFEIRVWSDTLCQQPKALISQVNFKIWEKFKKYEVEIPYPQRDVYLKEMPNLAPKELPES
jgi:small-conductance mechanosensitive channel